MNSYGLERVGLAIKLKGCWHAKPLSSAHTLYISMTNWPDAVHSVDGLFVKPRREVWNAIHNKIGGQCASDAWASSDSIADSLYACQVGQRESLEPTQSPRIQVGKLCLCVCVCIYIYIYTHTHTQIHTQMWMHQWFAGILTANILIWWLGCLNTFEW